MRSIILAAGQGNRLSSVTKDPKCLLRIGPQSLLERQLMYLPDPTIVVGHRHKKVMDAAKGAKFIYNPLYNRSNTLISLLFALAQDQSDTFVVNGDVYFDVDLPTRMQKIMFSSCAVTKLYTDPTGEEVCVDIDRDFVRSIGKHVRSRAESVGVYLLRKEMIEMMLETVPAMSQDITNLYYEDVLNKCLIRPMMPVLAIDSVEIDTPADYEQAVRKKGTWEVVK